MSTEVGDRVNLHDGSYSFGVCDGKYADEYISSNHRKGLTVLATGLAVMRNCNMKKNGEYTTVNDLLVTDGDGNFFFTQSRFVKKVMDEKNIEVKYLCNGEEVTDRISAQTKRNLAP